MQASWSGCSRKLYILETTSHFLKCSSKDNTCLTYRKHNFPMTPHVRQMVGRWVKCYLFKNICNIKSKRYLICSTNHLGMKMFIKKWQNLKMLNLFSRNDCRVSEGNVAEAKIRLSKNVKFPLISFFSLLPPPPRFTKFTKFKFKIFWEF